VNVRDEAAVSGPKGDSSSARSPGPDALRRAKALCAQADHQLQREDVASMARLRMAERLYAQASAVMSDVGPQGESPARDRNRDHHRDRPAADGGEAIDLDHLRARLLEQRADTLEQLYELARRQPPSPRSHHRLRWAYALIPALALIALGLYLRDSLNLGNVALGKHWTASSNYANLRPLSGTLPSRSQHFFFHTLGDREGWLEIDLERPTRIASAKIVNRDDCCQTRALPLVIEASVDHAQWRELARTGREFDVWRTSFQPFSARWVRLRVLRPSAFHLKNVILRS
jgi:hypothetical protein